MASQEPTNYDLYQFLAQQIASNPKWIEYLLLIAACFEIISHIPTSPEEQEQVDVEELLIQGLDCLGEAIAAILPGEAKEFTAYMPNHRQKNNKLQKYNT